MASNSIIKESIVGFVTDVSGEKRGPSKHYRRFNFITETKETLSGWIFGETFIEETSAGKILLNAQLTNTGVRIYGRIYNEQGGGRTIKIWTTNKFEKIIEPIENNETLSGVAPSLVLTPCLLNDALISSATSLIQVYVLEKHDSVTYMYNNIEKRYCTLIVGDTSGTTALVIYDDMVEQIKVNESWIFSQVKPKKVRDHIILATSAITTSKLLIQNIEPNLDGLGQTLAMNLIDEETIVTCIDEIGDVREGTNCSNCRQLMIPVEGKKNILNCKTCSRYALSKRNDIEAMFSLTIDNQKIVFWTAKGVLGDLFQQNFANPAFSVTDLCEEILSKGPWRITVSHFRRQIIKMVKV